MLRFTEREQTAADRKNKEDRRLLAGLSHTPQNCVFDGRICLWQAGAEKTFSGKYKKNISGL